MHCTKSMAKQIQLRRGTTAENNGFTGAVGEVSVDTDKDVLVVHDGVTVGGFPVAARANVDGTISLIKKDGTSAGSVNSLGLFNNTLTSNNTNQALTAAQGKVLKDSVDSNDNTAFGILQTYQNALLTKTVGQDYTNITNRPIVLYVSSISGNGMSISVSIDGVVVQSASTSSSFGGQVTLTVVVLAEKSYRVDGNVSIWTEQS